MWQMEELHSIGYNGLHRPHTYVGVAGGPPWKSWMKNIKQAMERPPKTTT